MGALSSLYREKQVAWPQLCQEFPDVCFPQKLPPSLKRLEAEYGFISMSFLSIKTLESDFFRDEIFPLYTEKCQVASPLISHLDLKQVVDSYEFLF